MSEIMKSEFFRVQKIDNRWTLIDPDGKPFFSVGLNHTEETNLKYIHNLEIWQNRYGSRENWIIDGVVSDMKKWSFNTIGWTQEVISKSSVPLRGSKHSKGWEYKDYELSGMPYCVNLEVADIAGWDLHPQFPDVFSHEFDDWCSYLVRKICANHCNSKNLIGYFLVDIPAWAPHKTGKNFPQLINLEYGSDEYNEILEKIAHQYYRTITKYIKQYDTNHLILGDRMNGNTKGIDNIYNIAKDYVDVISIQYFTQGNITNHVKMQKYFDNIYKITNKPLLLADIGNRCPTKANPVNIFGNGPLKDQTDRANDYITSIEPLTKKSYFIGWHWCAYIENNARGWGIKNPCDEPYKDFTNPISKFNANIITKKTIIERKKENEQ